MGVLPVHRDAEDPPHGAEDLADDFLAPVVSVLTDDNGLSDFCDEPGNPNYAPSGLIVEAKMPLLVECNRLSPSPLFIYLFICYCSVTGETAVLSWHVHN